MEELSETAAEHLQNRVDQLLQLFNGLVSSNIQFLRMLVALGKANCHQEKAMLNQIQKVYRKCKKHQVSYLMAYRRQQEDNHCLLQQSRLITRLYQRVKEKISNKLAMFRSSHTQFRGVECNYQHFLRWELEATDTAHTCTLGLYHSIVQLLIEENATLYNLVVEKAVQRNFVVSKEEFEQYNHREEFALYRSSLNRLPDILKSQFRGMRASKQRRKFRQGQHGASQLFHRNSSLFLRSRAPSQLKHVERQKTEGENGATVLQKQRDRSLLKPSIKPVMLPSSRESAVPSCRDQQLAAAEQQVLGTEYEQKISTQQLPKVTRSLNRPVNMKKAAPLAEVQHQRMRQFIKGCLSRSYKTQISQEVCHTASSSNTPKFEHCLKLVDQNSQHLPLELVGLLKIYNSSTVLATQRVAQQSHLSVIRQGLRTTRAKHIPVSPEARPLQLKSLSNRTGSDSPIPHWTEIPHSPLNTQIYSTRQRKIIC